MVKQVESPARGILNPELGKENFALARYAPSHFLESFVEHYWTVRWDLRGQPPYNSETLPHPAIHLTVEPETATLVGVVTHKFSRVLTGKGWVFGIKFNPGAFHPFVQCPISTYTDRHVRLDEVLGAPANQYAQAMRAAPDDAARVSLAEAFLRGFAPAQDEHVTLVGQIVKAIMDERAITKVDHLVSRYNINKRSLQRLFNEYVGVSPKWVIQRYRLHEATAQMVPGQTVDWSQLAVELGYFDQAHFIKDFKAIVGLTPAEYAKQLG